MSNLDTGKPCLALEQTDEHEVIAPPAATAPNAPVMGPPAAPAAFATSTTSSGPLFAVVLST